MIGSRIKDALILYENGSTEGAFICILIAVAATARKRYSRKEYPNDSEVFKKFLLDEMGTITGGPDSGVAFYCDGKYSVALEHIIYKILRCSLVHEGYSPQELRFTEPVIENGKTFNHLDLETDVIGLPTGWIWNLARVVISAPENHGEFNIVLPEKYPHDAGIKLTYPDNDPARSGVPGIENIKD